MVNVGTVYHVHQDPAKQNTAWPTVVAAANEIKGTGIATTTFGTSQDAFMVTGPLGLELSTLQRIGSPLAPQVQQQLAQSPTFTAVV